jgi:transcriptional regulator with XRE-family HTH domain
VSFQSLFGERLLNERDRLGLTQAQLATQSGLKREMIGRYERGAVMPGVGVLHTLGKHGIDVAYLLTGRPHTLSKEEGNLVAAFRSMDAVAKAALLGVVRGVQAQSEEAKSAKEVPAKVVKLHVATRSRTDKPKPD